MTTPHRPSAPGYWHRSGFIQSLGSGSREPIIEQDNTGHLHSFVDTQTKLVKDMIESVRNRVGTTENTVKGVAEQVGTLVLSVPTNTASLSTMASSIVSQSDRIKTLEDWTGESGVGELVKSLKFEYVATEVDTATSKLTIEGINRRRTRADSDDEDNEEDERPADDGKSFTLEIMGRVDIKTSMIVDAAEANQMHMIPLLKINFPNNHDPVHGEVLVKMDQPDGDTSTDPLSHTIVKCLLFNKHLYLNKRAHEQVDQAGATVLATLTAGSLLYFNLSISDKVLWVS